MMQKVNEFLKKYQDEFAWFVIGLLTQSALITLVNGQIGWFCFEVALIATNFFFWKARQE